MARSRERLVAAEQAGEAQTDHQADVITVALDRMWITCTVGTTLLPCAWIPWLGGVRSSRTENS